MKIVFGKSYNPVDTVAKGFKKNPENASRKLGFPAMQHRCER